MSIITKKQFSEFNKKFEDKYPKYFPHQRKGQAWINSLSKEDPYLTQIVIASSIDPFYDDSLLDKAIDYVNHLIEDV